jgi:hypothetical protein
LEAQHALPIGWVLRVLRGGDDVHVGTTTFNVNVNVSVSAYDDVDVDVHVHVDDEPPSFRKTPALNCSL